MTIKAFIFDFIGTLTLVKNYSLENSEKNLYEAIKEAGFKINSEEFFKAYNQAQQKYREIRYQKLVEVTNAVWVSEALNNLGFKTKPEDSTVKTAVNMFFVDYLNSLKLRPCAKSLLNALSKNYKLGLISNFTYAPVIYAGLRKLKINSYFNAVLVSEALGWRKPHRKIFEAVLKKLNVKNYETVYIGDSPLEDIKGAKSLGIHTIFIQSQFYSFKHLRESGQKPDFAVHSLCELHKLYNEGLTENLS